MDNLLWWKVKGYKGIQLTEEKLHSQEYSFDEVIESDPKLIKQIETKLEKGGVVFAFIKKKVIKAVYIFKLTTVNGEKVLVFDKNVVLDELEKCVKEIEKDISVALNEATFYRHDIDKVLWQEKEITKSKRFKAMMTEVKLFSWIGTFMLGAIALTLIVCGTLYSLPGLSGNSMAELKKDELIIDYVSYINNYSYSETIEVFSEFNDNIGFVVAQIIIPTVVTVSGYILLILSLLEVLTLVKDVVDHKTLFTNNNSKLLSKIILKVFIGLLLLFGLDDFVLWFGISIILFMFYYIFNYCVSFTIDKK